MNVFEILSLLEQTPGKNDKQAILRANKDNIELQQILDAAFNYSRRFYMKKFEVAPTTNPSATHEDFIQLLSRLEAREITGHEALHATEQFFRSCNEEQSKWYTRAIQQDLKIGVSVDTAIKCGFDIPKFEVQLAKDGKQSKKLDEVLKEGCLASRKYDGYRCIAIIKDGTATLYSRNGKVYENFPIIESELARCFPDEEIVLDGEIMSDDFNAMQRTAFASKRGTTVGDVKYFIFDAMPLNEWKTDNFRTTHVDRIKLLDLFFKTNLKENDRFVQVEQTPVASLEQIQQLEQQYIEEGYEGVMLNPNIPYFRGRKTKAMMKFKTMVSMDCRVVDFYEGKTGKTVGTLGGLIVEQENGLLCGVGSGLSDEERDWIWNNKEEVLNSIVEVKYYELTPDGLMRFPTKFRWRNDKG